MSTEIVAEDNTEEVHVAPKRVNISVDIINELTASIQVFVDGYKEFTPSLLVRIIPRLMAHVERYKTLTGEQKKSLVIHVLTKFADETLFDNAYHDEVVRAIETLVPAMVDTLVSVDLGQLRIKVRKRIVSCIG